MSDRLRNDHRERQGRLGIDTIIGNTANNKLFGNAGNDVISGAEGNDLLDGGSGNDRLDGGVGSDTAVFTGNRADYLIEAGEGDTFIIRDTRKGSADGTDTLISIEQLKFADGTKLLTQVAVQNVPGVSDGKQGYLTGKSRRGRSACGGIRYGRHAAARCGWQRHPDRW
jgi:Ca2+-binding RTX toxin-like protein